MASISFEKSHRLCVCQMTNSKYEQTYSQNTVMLYYNVLYNVSITCFGHWPSSSCTKLTEYFIFSVSGGGQDLIYNGQIHELTQ